ncbi:hypothetical protein N9195_00345 [bacterium]|nr:hypothetical protein [bacterium]
MGYNIEIMGINWRLSSESGNDLMTAGRDLPWLQDTVSDFVQGSWGATYRDVIILDASSRPLDPPFNLTVNDLSAPAAREALKQRLRDAAEFVDSDGDGLGDDWEERHFGHLLSGSSDDQDNDEESNFFEYALGSEPDFSTDRGTIIPGVMTIEGEKFFSLEFRRRLGLAGGLTYEILGSETGGDWKVVDGGFTLSKSENPYDGTGTENLTWVMPVEGNEMSLFRLKISR